MALAIGQILQERYQIAALLGQGGMGAVYRGTDLRFDAPVAIKENQIATPSSQKQFIREARLLHQLRHPHLPRVTDYFVTDQGQYLVMDYVEGQDLGQLLADHGSVPEAQALPWIGQVLDALEYLHSQDIIHRDVKPANIKVTPQGQAFLVDFGLAKVYDHGQMTTIGARGMTPGFAPPEQYGQGRTDARTDIYSLAATLYALLTGVIPPDSLILVIDEAQLVPPREINPQISPNVEKAILQAMQISPANRFQSVGELRAMLLPPDKEIPQTEPTPEVQPEALALADLQPSEDLDAQMPEEAEHQPPLPHLPDQKQVQPTTRKKQTRPFLIIIAVMVVVAVAAALFLLSNSPSPEKPEPVARVTANTPEPTSEPAMSTIPAVTVTLRPTSMPRPPTETSTYTPQPPTPTDTPRPPTVTPTFTPPPPTPTNTSRPPTKTATPLPGKVTIPLSRMDSGIPWLPLDKISGVQSLYFNVTKAPFDDRRVRQAFALAVNRAQVTQIARDHEYNYSLTPATTFTPPYILGRDLYRQVGLPFNLEQARSLLAQAGYPNGQDFSSVTLLSNATPVYEPMINAIADMWRQNLNVSVEVVFVGSLDELIDRLADPPTTFRLGWRFSEPDEQDPDVALGMFHSENEHNYARFADSEYDRLIEEAAATGDPATRQSLYIQAEQILCEQEAAVIPLFHMLEE